jgi:hypothetical protein
VHAHVHSKLYEHTQEQKDHRKPGHQMYRRPTLWESPAPGYKTSQAPNPPWNPRVPLPVFPNEYGRKKSSWALSAE